MPRAVVTGIGHGVPPRVLTNHDLEKIVETNDAWIVQRTGIRQRHICGPEESASTLSIAAAQEALLAAGVSAANLDLVLVATVTGDYPFPSTACLVQNAIGAKRAAAFDLGAACAGFIYGVSVAAAYIESKRARRILVVGVDTLSKVVDWSDRTTCVLFGDGAGAVVLEATDDTDRGVLDSILLSDGAGAAHIIQEVGGSRHPVSDPNSQNHRSTVYMAGAEVYRFAVNAMGDACAKLLEQAHLCAEDVDLFVPHQANLRIIRSAQERLGFPEEKVFINVQNYGNTSGGSVPIALYEAAQTGALKPGMLVMTVGFGAGLVWGANLIRW